MVFNDSYMLNQHVKTYECRRTWFEDYIPQKYSLEYICIKKVQLKNEQNKHEI